MRKDKHYIFFFLLFVNILMLMTPVIPHHHHSNGLICMKPDIPQETCCSHHNHHSHSADTGCDAGCVTHFDSRIPSLEIDSSPNYVFVATLFTSVIIESLLRPKEKRIGREYIYQESLHGTNISRAFGLRAPPYPFTA